MERVGALCARNLAKSFAAAVTMTTVPALQFSSGAANVKCCAPTIFNLAISPAKVAAQ